MISTPIVISWYRIRSVILYLSAIMLLVNSLYLISLSLLSFPLRSVVSAHLVRIRRFSNPLRFFTVLNVVILPLRCKPVGVTLFLLSKTFKLFTTIPFKCYSEYGQSQYYRDDRSFLHCISRSSLQTAIAKVLWLFIWTLNSVRTWGLLRFRLDCSSVSKT